MRDGTVWRRIEEQGGGPVGSRDHSGGHGRSWQESWCREHGVFPAEFDKWRLSATTALADPEDVRVSPQATRADKKLERELQRKDKALAETAALLVLSKKVAAIFEGGQ